MKLPGWLTTVSWLVRDTFRQSLASGLFWLLFGFSTMCILVCLSVSVSAPASLAEPGENPDFLPRFDPDASNAHKIRQSGVKVADGSLRLALGAVRIPVGRDARSAVHYLELILAAGVADAGAVAGPGWTAGFLPGFLRPDLSPCSWQADFPLGPPAGQVRRRAGPVLASRLFRGRHLAGLGVRTGVWDAAYLWSVPLLLLALRHLLQFLRSWPSARGARSCRVRVHRLWGLCWAMNWPSQLAAA